MSCRHPQVDSPNCIVCVAFFQPANFDSAMAGMSEEAKFYADEVTFATCFSPANPTPPLSPPLRSSSWIQPGIDRSNPNPTLSSTRQELPTHFRLFFPLPFVPWKYFFPFRTESELSFLHFPIAHTNFFIDTPSPCVSMCQCFCALCYKQCVIRVDFRSNIGQNSYITAMIHHQKLKNSKPEILLLLWISNHGRIG